MPGIATGDSELDELVQQWLEWDRVCVVCSFCLLVCLPCRFGIYSLSTEMHSGTTYQGISGFLAVKYSMYQCSILPAVVIDDVYVPVLACVCH